MERYPDNNYTYIENGGDSNIYAYIGGDVVYFIDPFGLAGSRSQRRFARPSILARQRRMEEHFELIREQLKERIKQRELIENILTNFTRRGEALGAVNDAY